jgi:hypothetical protein
MYPGCRRKANSFGLVGMKERVSTLGGELRIENGPEKEKEKEKGTTIMVSIPFERSRVEPHKDAAAAAGPVPALGKLMPDDAPLKMPAKPAPPARRRKEARDAKAGGAIKRSAAADR